MRSQEQIDDTRPSFGTGWSSKWSRAGGPWRPWLAR